MIAEGAAKYVAPWEQRPFSSADWDTGDGPIKFGRYRMVPDLLRRHDFVGWTQPEVEGMLGTGHLADEGFWIYAGEEYGMDIDPIRGFSLMFRLDSHGQVERVTFECGGPRC